MNHSNLLLKIALRHLVARRKQSIIAALGVMFGIGTFIILVSFMTGLNGLLDGLILNRTPHIRIYNEITPTANQPAMQAEASANQVHVVHSVKPKSSPTRLHNALPIIHYLEKHPDVLGVAPAVKAQVFYNGGSVTLNGLLNGVEVEKESQLFDFQNYVVEGSTDNLKQNENGILLGSGVAKKLSLGVGQRIMITSPSGSLFTLTIVGIFQSGLAEIDKVQSYVNVKTAQKILGENSNYITDINLKLKDIQQSEPLSKTFSRQFDADAVGIFTANAQFETGTKVRNIITYAVSVTLLVVAGFGIYNILNMMIYEKMNDIAILKAIGFSGPDVRFVFLSQAIIIGIVGALTGMSFGYAMTVLIDHTPFNAEAIPTITTYPVVYNPKHYIIGLIFALISTFLAGYLPSKKAEEIDPVDIIRGQ